MRGVKGDAKDVVLSTWHNGVAITETGSLQVKQGFRGRPNSFRPVKHETFVSKDVEWIMGKKSPEFRQGV